MIEYSSRSIQGIGSIFIALQVESPLLLPLLNKTRYRGQLDETLLTQLHCRSNKLSWFYLVPSSNSSTGIGSFIFAYLWGSYVIYAGCSSVRKRASSQEWPC